MEETQLIEKITTLLDENDYRVKVRKEKYGASVHYPYNELLDYPKEIINYKMVKGWRTGFWKNQVFFEAPQYIIRQAVALDIYFTCQSRGYDSKFINYENGDLDDCFPMTKLMAKKDDKVAVMLNKFLENRDNYDTISKQADRAKVKDGFDFIVGNIFGHKISKKEENTKGETK